MKVNMAAENQIKTAPSVSPAMVVRLGDIAASSIKSYTALWDPSLRSVSFMPQSKISAGRVRPWFTPQNATTASSRVAFARAQVIQQLLDRHPRRRRPQELRGVSLRRGARVVVRRRRPVAPLSP